MGLQKVDWYSSGLVFFLSFFLVGVVFFYSVSSSGLGGVYYNGLGLRLDTVSFLLSLLSVCLWVSLVFFLKPTLSSGVFLFLSVFFSVCCYCTEHSLGFWVFYELSILFLLVLLVLDSPYPERYLASWYLLGYVVFTSLPMLLCFIFLSLSSGGCNISLWCWSSYDIPGLFVFALLCVLFMTKVPFPPFQAWLPIVHAESPTAVSVCLSGYIMKLGVLGMFRFCSHVLPCFIFNSGYIVAVVGISVVLFLVASRELDGKRWLAFLSLSHISVVGLCFYSLGLESSQVPFYFCLGHGLSAGIVFVLLGCYYEVVGSRNWSVIKSALGGSLFLRVVSVMGIFTAASIPPTATFFCEVAVLQQSLLGFSGLSLLFCFYLFFSGLVPLFVLGFLLSRQSCVSVVGVSVWSYFSSVVFLLLWLYSVFLLV
uniref:NADH-ubiquinone oxidoreductase chain 4 n=1 Tax=Azygia robusta TaxID=3062496 RepID=A0AA50ZNJ1_9TREM|nr:NADH dehydrogenase subunit 4 [Azygia robusta]WMH04198.1 NADH dehydrogenase subunit 4 [Azygia robusta]WMH04210.1 NADH dehydrogenase subunit 4 [Azygia robusta]